jgi:uncharacterized membrane protein
MAKTPTARRPMPIVGAFIARPKLIYAFVIGFVAMGAVKLLSSLGWTTSAIIGWDVMCLSFFVLAWSILAGSQDPKTIRAKAATQDQGQVVILVLAIIAGAATIVAVAFELSIAKDAHGWAKALRALLAFGTVACSWTFVQLVFAFHYAHEYYGPTATKRNAAGCGLDFPGGEPPDYWDFVHFSIVIGAACQTADVAFTDKALRRIGGVHGVFAFVFNTGVLALTINLVVALIQ